MIGWFGQSWGAPTCEDTYHVVTPVGEPCLYCEEPIGRYDRGVGMVVFDDRARVRPLHLECHIRTIVGGLNHQQGKCLCCGGSENPDPPGMTRRQAARAAFEHWRVNQP